MRSRVRFVVLAALLGNAISACSTAPIDTTDAQTEAGDGAGPDSRGDVAVDRATPDVVSDTANLVDHVDVIFADRDAASDQADVADVSTDTLEGGDDGPGLDVAEDGASDAAAPADDATSDAGAPADDGVCVPSGPEVCDGLDNDCNGMTDEALTRSCYDGPTGTAGVAACVAGTQTCSTGTWGACVGEVLPENERCDGVDNDCDGATDDGNPGGGASCGTTVDSCGAFMACIGARLQCVGTFVGPSPTGVATNPGTAEQPLNTITAAIANAGAIGNGTDVCICKPSSTVQAEFAESVVMTEGVSLRGGYHCGDWVRNIAQYETRVRAVDTTGVSFPAGITEATALDGLTILGILSQLHLPPTRFGTAAAVTVSEASATFTDVTIYNDYYTVVYGIRATATLGPQHITATRGRIVVETDNPGASDSLATAVLLDGVSADLGYLSISTGNRDLNAQNDIYGIDCRNCGATTVHDGAIGGSTSKVNAFGITITGNAAGFTVSDESINPGSGVLTVSSPLSGNSYGIKASASTGPLLFRRVNVGAGNFTQAYGITTDTETTLDACTVSAGSAEEVYAVRVGGAPFTLRNSTIYVDLGSHNVRAIEYFGPSATIVGNTISGGVGGNSQRYASVRPNETTVSISGNAIIDSNVIAAPCPQLFGNAIAPPAYDISLTAGTAGITLINNVLSEQNCNTEVRLLGVTPAGPLTVANNTLSYSTCSSCGARVGLEILAGTGSAGAYDNNIFRGTGTSASPLGSNVVIERPGSTDPSAFVDNDLFDPYSAALFVPRSGPALTTAAQVDSTVPNASGTLGVDPQIDATWHLAATSPCRNAGTSSNAPATDRDGQPRPAEGVVDIGADEYVP